MAKTYVHESKVMQDDMASRIFGVSPPPFPAATISGAPISPTLPAASTSKASAGASLPSTSAACSSSAVTEPISPTFPNMSKLAPSTSKSGKSQKRSRYSKLSMGKAPPVSQPSTSASSLPCK